jgi:hypothetical protein
MSKGNKPNKIIDKWKLRFKKLSRELRLKLTRLK